MRFFERIRWLLDLMKNYGGMFDEMMDVFKLPDWNDSEAVREWALEGCDVLDVGADYTTGTEVDDEIAIRIRIAINSDPIWNSIWALIKGDDSDIVMSAADHRVMAIADDAKVSPTVVFMLVKLGYALYKIWKKRQENK